MKKIKVVAAIILQGDEILATQRGYGEFKGGWEFPGGKIEPGELPREALKREIKEELDVDIEVGRLLQVIDYDYPEFHLEMHCFICGIKSGQLKLKEHEAARWLTEKELYEVKWLPADIGLVPQIKEFMNVINNER